VAHIFWQVKADLSHDGRKSRRAGLSQEKALNRYPKMKHGPTLNTLGFRQTGLHGLGSFKKNGLLPKGKGEALARPRMRVDK